MICYYVAGTHHLFAYAVGLIDALHLRRLHLHQPCNQIVVIRLQRRGPALGRLLIRQPRLSGSSKGGPRLSERRLRSLPLGRN